MFPDPRSRFPGTKVNPTFRLDKPTALVISGDPLNWVGFSKNRIRVDFTGSETRQEVCVTTPLDQSNR